MMRRLPKKKRDIRKVRYECGIDLLGSSTLNMISLNEGKFMFHSKDYHASP